ncbi:MAG: hypothetical protein KDN22_25875 [Verrucomicrobiae bacterium]|nr:hypothetical protein [Verrucomicrobiae bacterium]
MKPPSAVKPRLRFLLPLITAAVPLLHAATPQVVHLVPLPEGFNASAVNDVGQCAGHFREPFSPTFSPAMTGPKGEGLILLSLPNGKTKGLVSVINNDGFVAGDYDIASDREAHFFGGGPSNLPLTQVPVTVPSGFIQSATVTAMNAAGMISGSFRRDFRSGGQDFVEFVSFTYDTSIGLFVNLQAPSFQSTAINNSGQLVGSVLDFEAQKIRAVRRDGLATIDLGGIGPFSLASDINDRGHVIGVTGISEVDARFQLFVHQQGSMTLLGVPPGDSTLSDSVPPSMNENGQILCNAFGGGGSDGIYLHQDGEFHHLTPQLQAFMKQPGEAEGFITIGDARSITNVGTFLATGRYVKGEAIAERDCLITLGGDNSWLPDNGASEPFFTDANWSLGVVPQVTQSYFLPDAISTLVFDRPYANVDLTSGQGGGHTFNLAGNFYSLKNTKVDGGSVVLVDGGGTFETERLDLGTSGPGEFKVLRGKLEVLGAANIGGNLGVTGRLVASGAQAEVSFKGAGAVVTLGSDPGAGQILAENGALIDWGSAALQSQTQGESRVTIQGAGTRSIGGRFTIAGKQSILAVSEGASFQTGVAADDGLTIADEGIAFFASGSTGSFGKLHFIQNGGAQFSGNAAFTARETKVELGGLFLVNTGATLVTQALWF